MESLAPWDELLRTVGRNVEDTGKTLRNLDVSLSIEELENLSGSLKNCATVLDQRIDSLKEEDQ